MDRKKSQTGFTLVELMVVIIIIGILIAIALPNFVNAQQRARMGALKTNAHTLQVSVEAYQVTHSFYPDSADELEALDAYQVFSNPFFPQYRGKATSSGHGAWWTNNDGDISAAPNALLGHCGEYTLSKGLIIYVGMDASGDATTVFNSATGSSGSLNPTTQYMIYGCDQEGRTIPRFVLSSGLLTPAGALLAGS
jgi:prepilin-type N-terminal cleavage/methylation domain-containing protein